MPDNEGLRSGVALSMDDLNRAFREAYMQHIYALAANDTDMSWWNKGTLYIKPKLPIEFDYELVDTDLP